MQILKYNMAEIYFFSAELLMSDEIRLAFITIKLEVFINSLP